LHLRWKKHFAHSPGFENYLPAPQIGVELIGSELRLGTHEHRLGLPETLHIDEVVLIYTPDWGIA